VKSYLFILIIFFSFSSFSQSFSSEKVELSNYLKRMISLNYFEGVKILDSYDNRYLISVLSLEKAKYTSETIMNRVAQIKAQSQANTFLNGATISMDMIINIKETKDSSSNMITIVEMVEQIKQNSIGFSQGLELLTNFDNEDKLRMVFIYIRELK